jgi:excisionase family DNA binding protein
MKFSNNPDFPFSAQGVMMKNSQTNSEISDEAVDRSAEIRMITVDQLAEILHVSTRTVWRLVSGGQLPQPLRFGRNVRWNYAVVRTWIERGTGGTAAPPATDQPRKPR